LPSSFLNVDVCLSTHIEKVQTALLDPYQAGKTQASPASYIRRAFQEVVMYTVSGARSSLCRD
jgi:hypothetical protein